MAITSRTHRILTVDDDSDFRGTLVEGLTEQGFDLRSAADETLLVVLNFGAGAHQLDLSAAGAQGELLLSSGMDRQGQVALAALDVGPNEGLMVRVAGDAVSI